MKKLIMIIFVISLIVLSLGGCGVPDKVTFAEDVLNGEESNLVWRCVYSRDSGGAVSEAEDFMLWRFVGSQLTAYITYNGVKIQATGSFSIYEEDDDSTSDTTDTYLLMYVSYNYGWPTDLQNSTLSMWGRGCTLVFNDDVGVSELVEGNRFVLKRGNTKLYEFIATTEYSISDLDSEYSN